MSYEQHEWVNGETITAAKMNNIEEGIAEAAQSGGGGLSADAIIHLEHANNSNEDSSANLTATIVSGTFADLYAKMADGGSPYILVEYHHPWGEGFTAPMGYVSYYGPNTVTIIIAGFSLMSSTFITYGYLVWTNEDEIFWD